MLVYLIAGISLGLSAGFSPGPLFAMVISQTIRHGLKEGVKAAVSPIITDVPIILVCTLLLSRISAFNPALGLISIVGGVFLLYLAYESMKIKEMKEDSGLAEETNSMLKGAVVNALSPHPYLFWIMVGSPMILNAYTQGITHAASFIVSFYICLIGAKVVLAVIVNKSRDFLQGKVYIYALKTLGALLIIFAFLLFKDGLNLLLN